MPPSAPPTVCQGPIAYKGEALLQRGLATFKAALHGVNVAEALLYGHRARRWLAEVRINTTPLKKNTCLPLPRP